MFPSLPKNSEVFLPEHYIPQHVKKLKEKAVNMILIMVIAQLIAFVIIHCCSHSKVMIQGHLFH